MTDIRIRCRSTALLHPGAASADNPERKGKGVRGEEGSPGRRSESVARAGQFARRQVGAGTRRDQPQVRRLAEQRPMAGAPEQGLD
jgi:hypothetical protein